MWKNELKLAKELAIKAGLAIMDIYDSQEDPQVEYKKGKMPLTAADKRANQIIVRALRKAYPAYAILSEEGQDNKDRLTNDHCFIVDPLDGTKEFLKRNGQFTVNIALAYKHKPVMGVIYAPAAGALFYASEGTGAFLERICVPGIERAYFDKIMKMDAEADSLEAAGLILKEEAPEPLKVSDRKTDLRVVMSSSHGCAEMDDLIGRHGLCDCMKIGSSLKGCLVAQGKAELYYRYNPTMEWDTAAIQCIVEEAGGIFRQMDDSPMRYNRENPVNEKGFYAINRAENRLR